MRPGKALNEECRCGHARGAHAHYRRGTECGLCGPGACRRYRPVGVLRRWSAVAALPWRRLVRARAEVAGEAEHP
jgi:hypothetical protein